MKKFIINDPLGNIICKLPDNHCLFCEHCHDYFYDYSSGPYLFLCDLDNGGELYTITDEDFERLKHGEIINFFVNMEYGCLLMYEKGEQNG